MTDSEGACEEDGELEVEGPWVGDGVIDTEGACVDEGELEVDGP